METRDRVSFFDIVRLHSPKSSFPATRHYSSLSCSHIVDLPKVEEFRRRFVQ